MAMLHKLLLEDDIFQLKICSTGQHRELLHSVQNQFQLPLHKELDAAEHNTSLSDQAAYLIKELQAYFSEERPDIIMVHGDTLSAYCGAVVSYYNKFKLCHIEAGLRTFNKWGPYPEEIHRRYIDLVSDLHFAPTEEAALNLLKDEISQSSIYITGNTGIDALKYVEQLLNKETLELDLNLKKQVAEIEYSNKKVALLTMHRREHTDQEAHEIYKAINAAATENNLTVLYPVHPNPLFKDRLAVLNECENILQISPLDYFSFVWLMIQSAIIFTDSGGIQEEAPAIGKPVVVLRKETERPEAIDEGHGVLINFEDFHTHVTKVLKTQQKAIDLYGEGYASQIVLNILKTSV